MVHNAAAKTVVFNLEYKTMTSFLIGVAVGVYVMGVLIMAFMKGMGGESKGQVRFFGR